MMMNIEECRLQWRFRSGAMRGHLALWLLGAMVFLLFAQATSAASLSINGAQKYQTIDGFGTNINSLSWTNDNSKAAIDLLADQMGQTLWRVVFDMEDWEATNDNTDANTPNWTYYNALYSNAKFQNLWGTLRYLNQKGFNETIALSFMGRVPGWMGSTTINASQEDEAVEMIATLIYYARNTEHVQFGTLDPFNETDWDGIEGPQLASTKYVRLLNKLSVKLDAMGLSDVRLLGPNTASISSGVGTYMPAMMADSVVMNKVDHFGFHSYSADAGGADEKIKNSAYSSKNFWMTEYANPADAFSLLGQNASALFVWEGFDSVYNHAILAGRGSQPGNDDVGYVPLAYNQSSHTYTPRKEFYQNAQLFKFVPPGAVRIAATGATGGLTSYAFYHQDSGRLTIVARNTGSAATVSATLTNLPAVTRFAYYKTDGTNNMAQGADVSVTTGAFSFSVPSGAIVTLSGVSAVSSAAALRSLSVNPENSSLSIGSTQQFKATGTYSDGTTQDFTSQTTWVSSNKAVATVNANGLATAVAAGATTISAALSGVTGSTTLAVQAQAISSEASIWPTSATPTTATDSDTSAVELGFKFRSSVNGFITGIRFYKSTANTGTHIGTLWNSNGSPQVQATFTNETASGWQQVNFASPVAITANTIYVASYHAPNGRYSFDGRYFASTGVTNGPLYALRDGESGGNGVYRYGSSIGFPSNTYQSSNYWVDVVFQSAGTIPTPPTLTAIAVTPANPSTISIGATQQFKARGTYSDGSTQDVTSQTTWVSSNKAVATVNANGLATAVAAGATTISAALSGVTGSSALAVQAQATPPVATTIWPASVTPTTTADPDISSVELGVKFRSSVNGFITGVRFYKGTANTGTHIGSLWDSSGNLLAQATFTNETASGWQQVNFASPVAITANTVYVASYHAPNGRYSVDGGYFTSTGITNGPLYALRNGESGGNGVYRYGSSIGFPSNTYQSSNYWVDVVFTTSTGF